MASAILHIKDAYYFEAPKFLWRSQRQSREDFPDWWVRLDPDFQRWEVEQLHPLLVRQFGDVVPSVERLQEGLDHWQHEDHANFARPIDAYLRATKPWFQARAVLESRDAFAADFRERQPGATDQEIAQAFRQRTEEVAAWNRDFQSQRAEAAPFERYQATWSPEKIAGYNKALDGKILIPQPPGVVLRNAYERESGFAISKYMVIELIVAMLLVAVFGWLGSKVVRGGAPKGALWNLLEVILLYLRDNVARPAIDSHDDHGPGHGHGDHGHGDHGHGDHGHGGHGHAQPAPAVEHHEGDRFVPLLWTIFVFVLGCNLFGLVPWFGSPTGALGATAALAITTFGAVVVSGVLRFGPLGFLLNQIPGMDLPLVLAILLKPMIFVIEIFGLLVKHAVLAIRLLANMVAGHLIILGIMGLAFTAEAAASMSGGMWWLVAVLSILGTVAINLLELFVAFLQAYIFTFLSALFIGAAVHKH